MLALRGGVTSGGAGRKRLVVALAWCAVGRYWFIVGRCWHNTERLHSNVEQLDGPWRLGQVEVANTQPVGIPCHLWEPCMVGAQVRRLVCRVDIVRVVGPQHQGTRGRWSTAAWGAWSLSSFA